jgi:two-component system, response regulator FlrC
VGGNRTIKVDVRVIATTNRQLEQAVHRKEFREDLYFRLNVLPIYVPPLRDHREDILLLAEHFLLWAARKHGCAARRLSDQCPAVLHGHHWPGNVRELQNVIERAVILAGESPVVEPANLCLSGFPGQPLPEPGPSVAHSHELDVFPPLREMEKRHIVAALDRCRDNRKEAATRLGISVRTLNNKLAEYSASTRRAADASRVASEHTEDDKAEQTRGR